jgi:hypothetical protein
VTRIQGSDSPRKSNTLPIVLRDLLLIDVQNEVARPHAHLHARREHFGEYYHATKFLAVVLEDNDFIAGFEHRRIVLPVPQDKT